MGEGLFVEIDIVLDENIPLKESHDIGKFDLQNYNKFFYTNILLGESLQFAIEEEDDVERCFVHLDYEYSQ